MGRPMFNYWSFEANPSDMEPQGFGARVGSFFTTALHFIDKTRWRRTGHLIK